MTFHHRKLRHHPEKKRISLRKPEVSTFYKNKRQEIPFQKDDANSLLRRFSTQQCRLRWIEPTPTTPHLAAIDLDCHIRNLQAILRFMATFIHRPRLESSIICIPIQNSQERLSTLSGLREIKNAPRPHLLLNCSRYKTQRRTLRLLLDQLNNYPISLQKIPSPWTALKRQH